MSSSALCHFSRPQSENKRKQKERQIPRSCLRAEKAIEQEGDSDTNCNSCVWNGPHKLGKGTDKVGNQSKNWDHPDYSIIEIRQNTEMSAADLKRLAVTQTPVKDYQLMLVWKTCKDYINNNNGKVAY